ncbi:hypothetical protein [Aliiroseovarius crassostreae]|uniref:hypothetical protein n=1 Tax=Aliiroseovarius crassostreae TaxID=154981 RepID=UPI003C7B656B
MFKKTVAIMALLAGLSATGAEALSLKQAGRPAENPPAGYKGDTYVDSRGCIYIRAGFSGKTTWVPRVTRKRQVVCGARPSGAASPSVVAKVPQVAPQPAPVATVQPRSVSPRVTVAQPAPVRGQPRSTRVTVAPTLARPAQPGPALPPRIAFGNADQLNPALPPRSAPPPAWSERYTSVAPVANPGPAPVARIVPDSGKVSRTVRVSCPVSGKVRPVMMNGTQVPIRCSAGQSTPVSYVVDHGNGQRTRVVTIPHPSKAAAPQGQKLSDATGLPGQTVSVPQGNGSPARSYRVVRGRDLDKSTLPAATVIAPQTYVALNMPVQVPKGYRPAWTDGRLNPMRGVRTIGGDRQTAQIWSEGTPRRLLGVQLPD